MAENLELGVPPLSIEGVERVARQGAAVQLAAAARARIAAGRHVAAPGNICYGHLHRTLPAAEALHAAGLRPIQEREVNSANDNPLVDPETGAPYRAGNFYGGHIARLLDTWKTDLAVMANWGNALMALVAAAQAVDLRGGSKGLGSGSRQIYDCIRQVAQFQDVDRPMEQEVAAVALKISTGALCF